ncbi:MAG TPA: hypothetical protein PK250_08755 [Syntrophobacter fumaroxidans]|nr:hypothetical protein [Syntrophobacter fumaroxidans]
MDLVEPLVSFDADARCAHEFVIATRFDLAEIRQDGPATAYVRRGDLMTGICRDHTREPASPA